MEIITIESKASRELMNKVDKIFCYVKEQKTESDLHEQLITSENLAEILGISTRTLQRLRSDERINYKIIYGRCYYDLNDIEHAIRERTLYCNPKTMQELHKNFKLKSTRMDDGVTG